MTDTLYCPNCGRAVHSEDGLLIDPEYQMRIRRCLVCGQPPSELLTSPPSLSLIDILKVVEIGVRASICDSCAEDACDPFECECSCHMRMTIQKDHALYLLKVLRKAIHTLEHGIPTSKEGLS